MYSYLGIFVFLLFASGALQGQPPGWTAPNPGDYALTANVVLVLNHEGSRENNPDNQVAFFANGDIRGVGSPQMIDTFGVVYFVTLYSNLGTEEMEIQVYHESSDQVYTAVNAFQFSVHQVTGTLEQPYMVHTFADGDAPISLAPFPDITIYSGIPMDSFDLAPYLISLDFDDVIWTYTALPDFDITINGANMFINPINGFMGNATLTITATEQTPLAKQASGTIEIHVLEAPGPPQLGVLPGEGILLNEMFTPFNLSDHLYDPIPPCVQYDYYPVLEPNQNPVPPPNWTFTGFYRNNMSMVVSPVFTPKYTFQHPDDQLAVYINGQIKGKATPVTIGDRVRYYVSVAGGAEVAPMTIMFYSGALEKLFTLQSETDYQPYAIIGSADSPYLLDFSPLRPQVAEDGHVEMIIQDTTWVGEQTFAFIAAHCDFPLYLADTSLATFCISTNGNGYTTLYRDFDGDGFGDPGYSIETCAGNIPGWVTNDDDCFDSGLNTACQYIGASDIPMPINVDFPDTIISTIEIDEYAIITGIKLNNLRVQHTHIGDLRISLISPSGRKILLIDQRCGGLQNMLVDFDSNSAHPYNDIPCPPNGGFCYQPLEDLSVLEGESQHGTWTLFVEDLANGDGGALLSWGLQICSIPCGTPGQENIYTGPSGNWSTPSRWSLGHVANACEHAIIDLDATTDEVQIFPDTRVDLFRLTVQQGILILPVSSGLQVRE